MGMSASHLSGVMRAAIAAHAWANNGPELTQLCDAIAAAVVAEVQAARITIPVTAVALQTSTTAGTPTAAPPAPIPIDGAVS